MNETGRSRMTHGYRPTAAVIVAVLALGLMSAGAAGAPGETAQGGDYTRWEQALSERNRAARAADDAWAARSRARETNTQAQRDLDRARNEADAAEKQFERFKDSGDQRARLDATEQLTRARSALDEAEAAAEGRAQDLASAESAFARADADLETAELREQALRRALEDTAQAPVPEKPSAAGAPASPGAPEADPGRNLENAQGLRSAGLDQLGRVSRALMRISDQPEGPERDRACRDARIQFEAAMGTLRSALQMAAAAADARDVVSTMTDGAGQAQQTAGKIAADIQRAQWRWAQFRKEYCDRPGDALPADSNPLITTQPTTPAGDPPPAADASLGTAGIPNASAGAAPNQAIGAAGPAIRFLTPGGQPLASINHHQPFVIEVTLPPGGVPPSSIEVTLETPHFFWGSHSIELTNPGVSPSGVTFRSPVQQWWRQTGFADPIEDLSAFVGYIDKDPTPLYRELSIRNGETLTATFGGSTTQVGVYDTWVQQGIANTQAGLDIAEGFYSWLQDKLGPLQDGGYVDPAKLQQLKNGFPAQLMPSELTSLGDGGEIGAGQVAALQASIAEKLDALPKIRTFLGNLPEGNDIQRYFIGNKLLGTLHSDPSAWTVKTGTGHLARPGTRLPLPSAFGLAVDRAISDAAAANREGAWASLKDTLLRGYISFATVSGGGAAWTLTSTYITLGEGTTATGESASKKDVVLAVLEVYSGFVFAFKAGTDLGDRPLSVDARLGGGRFRGAGTNSAAGPGPLGDPTRVNDLPTGRPTEFDLFEMAGGRIGRGPSRNPGQSSDSAPAARTGSDGSKGAERPNPEPNFAATERLDDEIGFLPNTLFDQLSTRSAGTAQQFFEQNLKGTSLVYADGETVVLDQFGGAGMLQGFFRVKTANGNVDNQFGAKVLHNPPDQDPLTPLADMAVGSHKLAAHDIPHPRIVKYGVTPEGHIFYKTELIPDNARILSSGQSYNPAEQHKLFGYLRRLNDGGDVWTDPHPGNIYATGDDVGIHDFDYIGWDDQPRIAERLDYLALDPESMGPVVPKAGDALAAIRDDPAFAQGLLLIQKGAIKWNPKTQRWEAGWADPDIFFRYFSVDGPAPVLPGARPPPATDPEAGPFRPLFATFPVGSRPFSILGTYALAGSPIADLAANGVVFEVYASAAQAAALEARPDVDVTEGGAGLVAGPGAGTDSAGQASGDGAREGALSEQLEGGLDAIFAEFVDDAANPEGVATARDWLDRVSGMIDGLYQAAIDARRRCDRAAYDAALSDLKRLLEHLGDLRISLGRLGRQADNPEVEAALNELVDKAASVEDQLTRMIADLERQPDDCDKPVDGTPPPSDSAKDKDQIRFANAKTGEEQPSSTVRIVETDPGEEDGRSDADGEPSDAERDNDDQDEVEEVSRDGTYVVVAPCKREQVVTGAELIDNEVVELEPKPIRLHLSYCSAWDAEAQATARRALEYMGADPNLANYDIGEPRFGRESNHPHPDVPWCEIELTPKSRDAVAASPTCTRPTDGQATDGGNAGDDERDDQKTPGEREGQNGDDGKTEEQDAGDTPDGPGGQPPPAGNDDPSVDETTLEPPPPGTVEGEEARNPRAPRTRDKAEGDRGSPPVPDGPGAGAAFPSDPLFGSRGSWGQDYADQWGLQRIGLSPGAALWQRRGETVVVAVIDTGVDRRHPELLGAMWINKDEIPRNGIDDDMNGYVDDVHGWNFASDDNDTSDLNGHGTVVAGIIAASTDNGIGIAGVNSRARIMPVRVSTWSGAATSIQMANAIRYAVDNGARVINVSYGGRSRTWAEYLAVTYARRKGVIIVTAAGNEAESTRDDSPAGLPGVVTVAATGVDDQRLGFSNWGGAVDIAAPGWDILSLRARGTDPLRFLRDDYRPGSVIVGEDRRYYRLTGTSFAAPFVSGVASLILSTRPDLSHMQVLRMLLHSATDIESPGWDQYTGYGRLNARAALAADPDYYVIARIFGATGKQSPGGTLISLRGRARADRFKRAWIEAAPGPEPSSWVKVSKDLRRAVDNGVIAEIPAKLFRGSSEWTLRLIVEHRNGTRREARFKLSLE